MKQSKHPILRNITLALCTLAVTLSAQSCGITSGVKKAIDNTVTTDNQASGVTIEEQLLLEHDGVSITATGIDEDSLLGAAVEVTVDNTSAADVGIGCDAVIVNNYMITELFSSTVAAGKKANDTISLMSSELEAAGISNIGQVEFYFYFFNPDTYERTYTAACVAMKTSAFDQMDTTSDDEGTELVNQNGIRIVAKLVDENTIWGSSVLLFIENTSDTNVIIGCDDMSVNGYMMTPYFYCTVYAGKKSIDTISLLSSELEENQITSISDIEVKFYAKNQSSYEQIFETGPISFSAS